MTLLMILNIVVHLFAVAALGISCYLLGRCKEELKQSKERHDEIRARIEQDKKSTDDAYRLIEEMCDDERQ